MGTSSGLVSVSKLLSGRRFDQNAAFGFSGETVMHIVN